jgi:hypothetical protein
MENSSRMKAKGLDTVQTQYNGRMREGKGLEGPRDGESETNSNSLHLQFAPAAGSFGESRPGEAAARCMQASRISRHAYHPKLKMT